METLNTTLTTVATVSTTLFNFATYDWTKGKLIRLAVVGGIFIAAVATVKYIESRSTENPETK